jgi:transcriptional regulator with XRE-family HTH domain
MTTEQIGGDPNPERSFTRNRIAEPASMNPDRAFHVFAPNRIAELRRASGLTLSELATKAGTTPATISKLERSEIKLSVEWMEKLAPLFRVKPADLVWPEDAPGTFIGRLESRFELSGHRPSDITRATIAVYKMVEEGMGRVKLKEGMEEEKQKTVDLIVLIFSVLLLDAKGSSGLLDESQIKAAKRAFSTFMQILVGA